MPTLLIKFSDNTPQNIKDKYHSSQTTGDDSGFDIYFPHDISGTKGQTKLIKLGIHCQLDYGWIWHLSKFFRLESVYRWFFGYGYDLLPRSSIYKKGIRLANSQGLIDQGYTGEIAAPVDFVSDYKCVAGDRAFQIALPSRQPFRVKIVDSLCPTNRGNNGLGSTGK